MRTEREKQRRVVFWANRLKNDLGFAAPELHLEKILRIMAAAMSEAEEHGYQKGKEDAVKGEHALSSLAESVGRRED